MKRRLSALLLAAMSLSATAVYAEDQVVTLILQDSDCTNCTGMVKKILARIDGVKSVTVKPGERNAVVTFDNSRTNAESLIDVAALAGYPTAIKR